MITATSTEAEAQTEVPDSQLTILLDWSISTCWGSWYGVSGERKGCSISEGGA